MADYQMIVLSNPLAGREDEYNDWYEGRHVDDVLKLPGFRRARRFVSDSPLPPGTPDYKYMAVYEFESEDIAATFGSFVTAAGTDAMPVSPALDPQSNLLIFRALGDARLATND